MILPYIKLQKELLSLQKLWNKAREAETQYTKNAIPPHSLFNLQQNYLEAQDAFEEACDRFFRETDMHAIFALNQCLRMG